MYALHRSTAVGTWEKRPKMARSAAAGWWSFRDSLRTASLSPRRSIRNPALEAQAEHSTGLFRLRQPAQLVGETFEGMSPLWGAMKETVNGAGCLSCDSATGYGLYSSYGIYSYGLCSYDRDARYRSCDLATAPLVASNAWSAWTLVLVLWLALQMAPPWRGPPQ